ncbi:MAG: SBBP repeat-containing protein [Bacteroidetes bacterium]|nr:SBBP repeat-containing protein [Bacteroidota bacterium]
MLTLRSGAALLGLAMLLGLCSQPAVHAQSSYDGAPPRTSSAASAPAADAAHRPILFTENIGQWEPGIRFSGTTGNTTIRFERDGVGFTVVADSMSRGRSVLASRSYALRTEFIGARTDLRIEGESPTAARFNYYLGRDTATWHTGARGFARVRYHDLYNGIDALYYGTNGGVKYDFVVAPGADHHAIDLRYNGARRLRILSSGELEATTSFGSIREAVPVSYQTIDGRRVPVQARYRLLGETRYGFELGAHDDRYPVVIDPCLSIEYSTYFGAGGYDVVTAIATDSSGNAYVTGFTRAPDFPVIPKRELDQKNWIFISKLSPDGRTLLYSTVIAQTYSGPYEEPLVNGKPASQLYEALGEDVEVTSNGEAVVALTTNIDSIATTAGAYQRNRAPDNINSVCGPPIFANYDCYVARLGTDGRLTWGTYLGGQDNDYLTDIALDPAGNVSLTGMTYAPRCGAAKGDGLNFPVTVPRDRFGSSDSLRGFETFVARLSSNGHSLQFGATYGGTGDEFATRIALDPAGKIYILGSTNSTNLPTTPNAKESSSKPGIGARVFDLYIARIDPVAGQLEYSSYFTDNGDATRRGLGVGLFAPRGNYSQLDGFARQHRRQGLAVEGSSGVIVFGGSTRSTSLPTTPGAYQPGLRNDGTDTVGYDCYVVRMNLNTNQVLGATYLGGSGYDVLGGLAIDSFGEIALGISTASRDFPLSPVNLQSEFKGNIDGVLATMSSDLKSLTYATFWGGAVLPGSNIYEQSVYGVTVDRAGAIYMYGGTTSRDFPISPAAITPGNDYYGGYIVKFSAPTAPKIGAGLSINFDPNLCGDLRIDKQVIFNSGQTPMRIDSLYFRSGKYFSLPGVRGVPFVLAPCDTIALNVAFDGTQLDCATKAVDSLVIVAPQAVEPRVALPVTGRRTCVTFGYLDTVVTIDRYKLNSKRYVGFGINVRGDIDQPVTVTPDPGNTGIFVPPQPIIDHVYDQGTSNIAFQVLATDTGYYCESFTATVQPCNRVQHLKICAHVTSGFFTAPGAIDYGVISCREISEPFVVHNTGNDTLVVNVAYVGGTNPFDINFTNDVQTPRHIGPGDSTVFNFVVRPIGYGKHQSVIVFQTDEGGENGTQHWLTVSSELDSTAFRLSGANITGGFGDIIPMPLEYEPVLSGRVPLEEATFFVRFNPKLLDLAGIDQTGTLATGWELAKNVHVDSGAIITLRKGTGGASFTTAGLFTKLQFKVLRGDTTTTPVALYLAGVSKLCLTAELDTDRVFQLNAECAAGERLLYTGRRVLKQSIPNPASGTVTIPYHLPEAAHATLVLYDAAGREVLRLVDEEMNSGDAEATFDTRLLAPGYYFYRLTLGDQHAETRSMVIER